MSGVKSKLSKDNYLNIMLLSASVASVVGWKSAAHRSLVGIASIGHRVPDVKRQTMNAPDVVTMDLGSDINELESGGRWQKARSE